MGYGRKIAVSLVMGLATLGLSSGAFAQQPMPASAGPTKIGVVSLKNVMRKIQEMQDSASHLSQKQNQLALDQKAHQADLEKLQSEIANTKVGTPEHEQKMEQMDKMSIDDKAAETAEQVAMVREQAHDLVHAFTEVQAAVAAVAKKRGLDLVLVDNNEDLPTNARDIANQDTLGNLIFNRQMMYSSDTARIDSDVIALLDNQYKQGQSAPAPGH